MERLFRPVRCLRALDFTARLRKFTPISPMKFSSRRKSKFIKPEGIGHLHSSFAQLAGSKFNIPPARIDRMCKLYPTLKNFKTLEKVKQFVYMLENIGCKPDQIAKIMTCCPKNLTTSVDVLQPKLQLLRDSGIEERNVAKVLTFASAVLSRSLEHDLLPKIKLLKSVFQSHGLFIKAVLKSPKFLTARLERLLKSIAFWKECGISGMDLAKFSSRNPYHLLCSSFTPAQADLMHAIGVDKKSKMYKDVLWVVMTHRIETLELKMLNLQQCGLSTEEIMELFRVCPYIFTFSTEKVRQTMQFLINDMELPANSVIKHPLLLKPNLESAIKPRFLVLQAIKSMDGLGPFDPKWLRTILGMPEERFLRKIVQGHTEHIALSEVYEQATAKISSGKEVAGGEKSL